MLKTLRTRLTVICTILTSLVLAAAMCVTWQLACRQYRESTEILFTSAFSEIKDRLRSSVSISDSWLAKQEMEAMCLVRICDNGMPLRFQGAWQPETDRETLLDAAEAEFEANGSHAGTDYDFTLAGENGDTYQGRAVMIGGWDAANHIMLILLRDNGFVSEHVKQLTAEYCFLWLAFSAVLCLVSWFLMRLALRPTAQALKRQNEFVAAASHELRSPLAVIKASLSAAAGCGGIPEQAAGFLAASEREADRMTRLTEDLLLLAGGDAGVWHTRLEPMELDTFCIELYGQYYPLVQQKGRTLEMDVPEAALPAITADAERLRQLFGVLINNALEYAPQGTAITLRARADGRHAELCVIDRGKGIADADKPRVFDRFYRADQSRTDKSHFGLGLAVAKEIAGLHGAAISVKDTPGGGATFAVVFPIWEGRPSAEMPKP